MEGRLSQEGWGRRNGAGKARQGQEAWAKGAGWQGREGWKKDRSRQAGTGGLDRAAGARGWVCRGGREPPAGAGDESRKRPSPRQVRVGQSCRTLLGAGREPAQPGPAVAWGHCGFAAPSCVSLQAAMDGAPPPPSPAGLSAYVAVSQLLGLTLLATTGAWLGRYRGGVAWHSPLQFNAHPLCMVLAMVFLQGDGEQDRGTALSQPQPPQPAAVLGQGMTGTKC